MEEDAINLTFKHEWMTVSEAKLLLIDAYKRFRKQKRYGGDIVKTLMKVEYGIWMRSSEEHMRVRLDLLKSRMDSNSTGRDGLRPPGFPSS